MRRVRLSILLSVVFFLLVGCVAKPTINKNYNKQIDFQRYQTFNIKNNGSSYPDLVDQYIDSAIITELTRIGYKQESNAQLSVYVNKTQKNEVDVEPNPMLLGGMGNYGGWPGYNDIYEYTEGYLTIDIVDNKLNKLIWRAVINGELSDNNQSLTELSIQNLVNQVFTPFP